MNALLFPFNFFTMPSQVNWMHYELESKLKSYLFWLHGNKSLVMVNISVNCKTMLIFSHVNITLV